MNFENINEVPKKKEISTVQPKTLSLEIPKYQKKPSVKSNSESKIPISPLMKRTFNLIGSPKANRTLTNKFPSTEYQSLMVGSPKNELNNKQF